MIARPHSISLGALRPVVAHRVDGPRVFNDEEWYPLPFTDVGDVDATSDDGKSVGDKKADIEIRFMPRNTFVVRDVEQLLLYGHIVCVNNTTYLLSKEARFVRIFVVHFCGDQQVCSKRERMALARREWRVAFCSRR